MNEPRTGEEMNRISRRELLAKGVRWTLVGSTLPILAACGSAQKVSVSPSTTSSQAQKAKYTIKFGSTATNTNPVEIGYQKFAQLVESKTKGNVQVQLFCCSSLGADHQLVVSTRSGALQMGTASNNNMDAFISKMEVFELPYLIRDAKTYFKVWDGPIGQEVKKDFEDQLGIKILMVMNAGGFRSVETVKRQVLLPKDLQGLKLRVAQTPVEIATFRTWGADPVPLAYDEVFTALEDGTVDGEVLQPVWFYSDKHYEAAKHLTHIHYVMLVHIGFINLEFFKGLPSQYQTAIVEAAEEAQTYEREITGKAIIEAKQGLIKHGVQWIEPSPSELSIWEKTSHPVWKQFEAKIGGGNLIRRIEKIQGA